VLLSERFNQPRAEPLLLDSVVGIRYFSLGGECGACGTDHASGPLGISLLGGRHRQIRNQIREQLCVVQSPGLHPGLLEQLQCAGGSVAPQLHGPEVVVLDRDQPLVAQAPAQLDAFLVQGACRGQVACHPGGHRQHVEGHLLEPRIISVAREGACFVCEGAHLLDVVLPERPPRPACTGVHFGRHLSGRSGRGQGLLAQLACPVVVTRPKRRDQLFVWITTREE